MAPGGQPEQVKVHDFPTGQGLGKAIPYGVYDMAPTPAGSASAPTTTRPRSPCRDPPLVAAWMGQRRLPGATGC